MTSQLHVVLAYVLMAVAVLLAAGAMGLLGYFVYVNFLGGFLHEVSEESAGSVKRVSSVVIRKLGTAHQRFVWPAYADRMRRRLIRAGEPGGYRPEDIFVFQEFGLIFGLLFGLVVTTSLRVHFGFSLITIVLFGLYPLIWVNDQVKKRHLQISRALPYNIDLLTLSVEAGLDFTAALAKVVEKGKAGPLRDELSLVLKQLKMGKTREEALKTMIARVDLPALTTFVNALIQADKMGTSLGRILRIQSTQMRIDRTQRAEKLANEAPVKMLFPLIACIFPTVFMVLFGPIVFTFIFGNVVT